MTPELRKGLFDVAPDELGIHLVRPRCYQCELVCSDIIVSLRQIETDQSEEAEKSKKGVIEPSESLLEMLNAMGVDESTAKFVLIQTKNKGVEEALDYLERLGEREVQAELTKYQANINSANTKKKRKPKYIPLELQRLFSELQLINRCTVSTNGKFHQ
jgi:hypothetical protein